MTKESPLQYDMFTGEWVDPRTRAQKKHDRERDGMRQMQMFSSRDVAQFGVNPNPTLPISVKTRLELVIEDPRTEEEKECDRKQAAEEQTYPMLPKTEPPLRQYENIKQQFPQAIVFLRLDDFYETFHGDAEIVARELDIVLTSHELGEKHRIPMAGVPYHSAKHYITRLIEKGYHVAVCERVGEEENDTPMPREVLRVVTANTRPGS